MATLARDKGAFQDVHRSLLSASVPTPFPSQAERNILFHDDVLEELASEPVFDADGSLPAGMSEPASTPQQQFPSHAQMHDIMPSIASLQQSCLNTLNDLLFAPTRWSTISPYRQHSPSEFMTAEGCRSPVEVYTSALKALLSNLRNLDSGDDTIKVCSSDNSSDLIRELFQRIELRSASLPPTDAALTLSLASLLSNFTRLHSVSSHSLCATPTTPISSLINPSGSGDVFDTLRRHLSDLQIGRLFNPEGVQQTTPSAAAIESALLWSKIDEELEDVMSMCRERTESLPCFVASDCLPPQYEQAGLGSDKPPEYEPSPGMEVSNSKTQEAPASFASTTSQSLSEKMRLDFEAVTMAIDRLYRVAPQLHNQRAELRASKVKELEKARREGGKVSLRSGANGKGKQKDVRELENILDMLGKASERKYLDQTVVIDSGFKTRVENSRLLDQQKRDAFVENLLQHSEHGRLHDQDAILQPHKDKDKDPEALLSLPEFIREPIPPSLKFADPHALLSLPEFVNEPLPDSLPKPPPLRRSKSKRLLRGRSLSAPPLSLSWLKPSNLKTPDLKTRRPSSARAVAPTITRFNIHYVAEYHENLQHILLFLSASGVTPGVDLEAEVFSKSVDGDCEYLIIKSGTQTSAPLPLPGRVSPGKKAIKVQSGHYEIKLSTSALSDTTQPPEPVPLLDASQLSTANPTTFICASCSLPLVQTSNIIQYRDLPSEHWEELVDAWMCHSDQAVHAQVARHAQGFWPQPNQALVGGSYILFEQSSVLKNNLCLAEPLKADMEWRLVRCLCGALTGRSREIPLLTGPDTTCYRFLKYSIRPVSPTTEPCKIPLSAFIVEDMLEFVHAHATYRFVILDEEEERPRLLMWLFKPTLRLAYTTPAAYSLPQTGCVHVAKVMYKLVGPSVAPADLKSVLDKYPGFPQAQYRYYPLSVCRRIAGLLVESNSAYPEGMRTMTGLDVGWLLRA